MLRIVRCLALGLGLFAISDLPAQTPPPAAPRAPPCADAPHRQFDFWVGSWDVTPNQGGPLIGRSRVDSRFDACVIHEHWFGGAPNGGQGGTGQSFNAYDRRNDQWGQYWVDFSGTVLLLTGGIVDGSMVLQGEVRAPNGSTSLSRISWTLMPDGRVRQVWSNSTDGGKTWQVAFDGWYRKKA